MYFTILDFDAYSPIRAFSYPWKSLHPRGKENGRLGMLVKPSDFQGPMEISDPRGKEKNGDWDAG
jgi:hypothetical protein